MSDWLPTLIEYLRAYGILILGPAIIVQSNGIPVGANLMTLATGAFAYAGEIELSSMALSVLFFLVIGDSLSYTLWRFLGNSAIRRFPRLDAWICPRVGKARLTMDKYGWWSLLFTRFPFSALGPPMNILSGLTEYRFHRFLAASIIGESFWTGSYLGLGFYFGDSWEDIMDLLTEFGQMMWLLAVLAVILYLLFRSFKRKPGVKSERKAAKAG